MDGPNDKQSDGSTEPKTDLAPLRLQIQYVKGVGPDRAEAFERIGLQTVRDLLFYFPRDYKDASETVDISDLENGLEAKVTGTVEEIENRSLPNGKTIIGVLIRQGNFFLRASWFNQPFMLNRFRRGQQVIFDGVVKQHGLSWQMTHPKVQLLDEVSVEDQDPVIPVYRLTEGIKQHHVKRAARYAVEQYASLVPETLPNRILEKRSLLPITDALKSVHTPQSQEDCDMARYRLVYQELLIMQLALAMRRHRLRHDHAAPVIENNPTIDGRIRRLLAFELTEDQNNSIGQICDDMQKPLPMNRLLQGDVGTGKTAVAAYASLVAIANKYQVVLMAPTEVLAQQHFRTFTSMLAKSQVRLQFLSGSSTASERKQLIEQIESGDVDFVIATQAILHANAMFKRLGLVIIDEQHKFGVRQRALLRNGNTDPHYLVMTATPIPRTIAMTLYGDLDVSLLREMPPGRSPIKTYWTPEDRRAQWWEFFRKKLLEGRQGYVISPLVDEDADEIMGAEQVLENLANGELSDFRIDLLHGRMNNEDKQQAMADFASGKTQVLIATTVIEVGIDVPNSAVMTIEHAERFGLSQLHQLRGRIGRGKHPGFLCVFGNPTSELGQQRLEAFANTPNGFDLAEIDFSLRGPGELFGTKQHGMPPLMIANLQRDQEIIKHAREDAREIIDADPELKADDFSRIKTMVLKRYGDEMDLSDVG